jgi:Acetamidase/Formamidase family
MGGCTDFHVRVIEGGIQTSEVTIHLAPVPGRVELRSDEFPTFIGFIGVSDDTDARVAYRNACLNVDEYLTKISDNGPQDRLALDAARSRVGRPRSWAPPTAAARSACGLRSSTSRSNTPRPPVRAGRGTCAMTSYAS